MELSQSNIKFLLIIVSFVCIIIVLFLPPIPQDENYHHFADTCKLLLIPNFWNVVSNLTFLLVGIMSIQKLLRNKLMVAMPIKAAYYIFSAGILLVGFGSAWYHYNPCNNTLVWDRLPMTLIFMSLLSIALAEFLSIKAGRFGLIPFLLTGIASIIWWHYGNGDLRLYALVQFLPIILLSLLFLFGQSLYNTKRGYLTLFITYLLAKLAEHFDANVYEFTNGLIAGHFLKHIITAFGLWMFLMYLQNRKPVIV